MKKLLRSICVVIVIILSSEIVYAYGDVIPVKMIECKVLYNNALLNFIDKNSCELPLLEYNNNIYVPIRSFNEQIGNKVIWNGSPFSSEIEIINNKPNIVCDRFGDFSDDSNIMNVSIINLIATPERYYNKHICVQGIVNIDFEADYLFLTSDDRKFLNLENSIALSLNNINALNKLETTYDSLCNISGQYCTIEGVFNESICESNGFLSDINLIDCSIPYY